LTYRFKTYYRKEDLPPLDDINFFHFTSSFDWYDAIPAYTPLMIVGFDPNEKPVVALFAVIKRMNRLFAGSFFKRCFVQREPAFFCKEVQQIDLFHQLITHLVKEVEDKVFIIQYESLTNAVFGYKGFRENNFYYAKWISVRNSLQRKRKIWDQLTATRKNQINKAKKNGVTIEELEHEKDLPDIYEIIRKANFQKIHHRFPPFRYFENFYHHYIKTGKGKILVARYQREIIGGIVIGFENNTTAYCIYYWGKLKLYKFLHPTTIVIFSAMEMAEKEGYSYFDFLDTGFLSDVAGQTRFLLQFGGKKRATRQWYRINWRLINFIMKKFYG